MKRNLKSSSLCVQFMVFCCILHCFVAIFVVAIFAVLSQDRFVAIYAPLCEEKSLAKNSACGEKMTNIRYGATSGLNGMGWDELAVFICMSFVTQSKKDDKWLDWWNWLFETVYGTSWYLKLHQKLFWHHWRYRKPTQSFVTRVVSRAGCDG